MDSTEFKWMAKFNNWNVRQAAKSDVSLSWPATECELDKKMIKSRCKLQINFNKNSPIGMKCQQNEKKTHSEAPLNASSSQLTFLLPFFHWGYVFVRKRKHLDEKNLSFKLVLIRLDALSFFVSSWLFSVKAYLLRVAWEWQTKNAVAIFYDTCILGSVTQVNAHNLIQFKKLFNLQNEQQSKRMAKNRIKRHTLNEWKRA